MIFVQAIIVSYMFGLIGMDSWLLMKLLFVALCEKGSACMHCVGDGKYIITMSLLNTW